MPAARLRAKSALVHALLTLAALAFASGTLAQSATKHYALLESTLSSPSGSVRTVLISIMDADRQACEVVLAGFRHGKARSRHAASSKPGREGCLTALPQDLGGVAKGEPLPGAFYVIRKAHMANRTDDIVDILYGLNTSDPRAVCGKLLEMYRPKSPDVRCVAPGG
jgi:hypothetical protein